MQDHKWHDKQDNFWVAGPPCIMHIMPDLPAERILFFLFKQFIVQSPWVA